MTNSLAYRAVMAARPTPCPGLPRTSGAGPSPEIIGVIIGMPPVGARPVGVAPGMVPIGIVDPALRPGRPQVVALGAQYRVAVLVLADLSHLDAVQIGRASRRERT